MANLGKQKIKRQKLSATVQKKSKKEERKFPKPGKNGTELCQDNRKRLQHQGIYNIFLSCMGLSL